MCINKTQAAADNVSSLTLLRPPPLMASSDGAQVDAATLAGAKPRVLVSQRYIAAYHSRDDSSMRTMLNCCNSPQIVACSSDSSLLLEHCFQDRQVRGAGRISCHLMSTCST